MVLENIRSYSTDCIPALLSPTLGKYLLSSHCEPGTSRNGGMDITLGMYSDKGRDSQFLLP